jgi:hypothetical protein
MSKLEPVVSALVRRDSRPLAMAVNAYAEKLGDIGRHQGRHKGWVGAGGETARRPDHNCRLALPFKRLKALRSLFGLLPKARSPDPTLW